MNNPDYAQHIGTLSGARHTVAYAWINGTAEHGSNFRTDGSDVFSYAHRVGYTADDGSKVAIICSASQTTRKQTGPMQVIADRTVPCEQHPGRTAPRQYTAEPHCEPIASTSGMVLQTFPGGGNVGGHVVLTWPDGQVAHRFGYGGDRSEVAGIVDDARLTLGLPRSS